MISKESGMAKILRESSDFISDVVGFDPNDLYHDFRKPAPSRMPIIITRYITGSIEKGGIINTETRAINLNGILEAGLRDAQSFYHDALSRKSHQLNPEKAARIIRHPMTTYTLAGLSLQAGADELDGSNFTNSKTRQFGINEDFTAITPGLVFHTDTERGCPFAGKNGEINPGAIYSKFSIWAGTLAVQTYFNHFHNIDPTPALRQV